MHFLLLCYTQFMTERDGLYHAASERLRRTLASNAFLGLDADSHCHDSTIQEAHPAESEIGDDSYVVTLDMETGRIIVGQLDK